MRGRRLVVAAGVVAGVAVLVVGRLVAVHRETWDWRLTPATAPTKLTGYALMGGPWLIPVDSAAVDAADRG